MEDAREKSSQPSQFDQFYNYYKTERLAAPAGGPPTKSATAAATK
jgi:hypothetical protein